MDAAQDATCRVSTIFAPLGQEDKSPTQNIIEPLKSSVTPHPSLYAVLFAMFIAVLTLELLLHDAHSLKEKRVVVQGVLDRVRARFNVSAAQLDDDDLWNRAQLGFAAISNDRAAAERALHRVRDCVETFYEAQATADVVKCELDIL
jgi:uncharacterized protein YlxP (DUF503 family)